MNPNKPGAVRPAKRLITDTVPCPDCGFDADALFGNHGGDCAPKMIGPGASALDIIRDYARDHEYLSINELRCDFDRAGIKEGARGGAFGMAKRRKVIEAAGHVPSTDQATKGHHVQTYRSLHPKFARTT